MSEPEMIAKDDKPVVVKVPLPKSNDWSLVFTSAATCAEDEYMFVPPVCGVAFTSKLPALLRMNNFSKSVR